MRSHAFPCRVVAVRVRVRLRFCRGLFPMRVVGVGEGRRRRGHRRGGGGGGGDAGVAGKVRVYAVQ